MQARNKKDSFRGALIGMAAGDALGTTLEFTPAGAGGRKINEIVGGGVFNLEPGQWTDDTSMALCMAESLVKCDGFDAKNIMQKFLSWYQNGYLSSNGKCFDIGNTTATALSNFARGGNAYAGISDESASGNGGIMRLAPIPLWFARIPQEASEMAAKSSSLTHASVHCIDAARYMAGLIVGGIEGDSKPVILSRFYHPSRNFFERYPFRSTALWVVAGGSFKNKQPPEIRGTGFVVRSLEAALWAFHNSDNFVEGALKAVHLGEDADTTGAIYGQIAGAYYGASSIPDSWIQKLSLVDKIIDFADKIYEHYDYDSRETLQETKED